MYTIWRAEISHFKTQHMSYRKTGTEVRESRGSELIAVGDTWGACPAITPQGGRQGCISAVSGCEIQCESSTQVARDVRDGGRPTADPECCNKTHHLSSQVGGGRWSSLKVQVVHGCGLPIHDRALFIQTRFDPWPRKNPIHSAQYGKWIPENAFPDIRICPSASSKSCRGI